MAKREAKLNPLVVDRVLLVGVLLAATGYIIRGSWPSEFFYASALILGVVWSFRAITTSKSREFRLLATLLLVLLGALLAFALGSAKTVV